MRKCRLPQHQLPHPACVPKRSPPRQVLFCASHDGGEGARAWKVYGGRVVAISRPSSRLDDDSVCWWRYELAGDEAPPPPFLARRSTAVAGTEVVPVHNIDSGAPMPQMRCNCPRSWSRGVHALPSPMEAIHPSILRYVGVGAPACPSSPLSPFWSCLQVIPGLACLLPCRLFGLRSFVLLLPPAHTHSFRPLAHHNRQPPLIQHFRSYNSPACCSNHLPSWLLPSHRSGQRPLAVAATATARGNTLSNRMMGARISAPETASP